MYCGKWVLTIAVLLGFVLSGCSPKAGSSNDTETLADDGQIAQTNNETMNRSTPSDGNESLEQATFGAGCFWCVEAVFQRLKGVKSVSPGYAGGHVKNPTYDEVCTGNTGHAEVCRIVYDPNVISYEELLEVFWKTHNPTTKNKQGPDEGPQYRSVIFYHNEKQKKLAETSKQAAEESGVWKDSIVTEIESLNNYYAAENYHENYYERNPDKAYCQAVIRPKIEKFEKQFREKLKSQK